MNEEFITAKQAAEIAGVTTNTIQNLCRAKAIRHRMRGHMYYVSKDDIEKYKDKIEVIHEAEVDIAEYEEQILNRKAELLNAEEDLHFRIVNMQMFPQRINAIFEILYAALNHYEIQWQDSILTEREVNMLKDGLKGKTLDKMSDECGLTRARVLQLWHRALHKFATAKNELARRDDIIADLKEHIKKQNEKIFEYEHPERQPLAEVYSAKAIGIAKALMLNVKDLNLSVRCLNGLDYFGIETLYDLVKFHRIDLLKARNFGKKSLTELDELLERKELSFAMPTEKYESIMLELKTKVEK